MAVHCLAVGGCNHVLQQCLPLFSLYGIAEAERVEVQVIAKRIAEILHVAHEVLELLERFVGASAAPIGPVVTTRSRAGIRKRVLARDVQRGNAVAYEDDNFLAPVVLHDVLTEELLSLPETGRVVGQDAFALVAKLHRIGLRRLSAKRDGFVGKDGR